jgi:Ca2+-binding RTX toxin-like protein
MSKRSKSSDFANKFSDLSALSISTQGIWLDSSAADPADGPVDPLFGEQENLFSKANGSADAVNINVTPVWSLGYSGRGISVGVYDTAMDIAHADLSTNAVLNKKIKGGNATIISETGDEHATSVAGIIAAARNGEGVVGIAYDAKISPINIFDDSQRDSAYVWNVLKQQSLFHITNHSWSFTGAFAANPLVAEYAAALSGFTMAADLGRGKLGTIANVAAGNYRQLGLSTETNGLTVDRHVVVVGATDHLGSVAYYSNPGASILVVAPSSDSYTGITTTDVTGLPGYSADDYTSTFGGTSAATPQIAGIQAAMLEANPGLGWRDVQKILSISANHTGSEIGAGTYRYEASAWIVNAAGNWNGGGLHFSNDYGFGMADAYAAVLLAEDWFKAFAGPAVSANELSSTGSTSGSWSVGQAKTTDIQIEIGADQAVEAMVLNLNDLRFSASRNLTIDLISPSGTVSRLLDQNGLEGAVISGGWQLMSRAFQGESAAGTWTIRISSASASDVGNLGNLSLTAYGSSAEDKSVFFYTDEFSKYWTEERSLLDYQSGPATIFASAVTGSILLDLRTGTGFIGDSPIAIAAGTYVRTVITGDAGSELTAGDAGVRFFGGRGTDTLTGGAGNDVIDGGDGDDTIDGGAGNNVLSGGAGVDTLSYASASSGVAVSLAAKSAQQTGGAAVNTISGFENLTGSSFADSLTGDSSDNVLDGGDGDDLLIGGGGADSFIGGAGIDTVSYALSKVGVVVDLGAGTASGGEAEGDTFEGIENVIGTKAGDWITGDDGGNELDGGAGNDTLSGGAGNDVLIGGAGADILIGGPGRDAVSYATSRSGVFIDLARGIGSGRDAQGDTFVEIENVIGTNAADTLIGDEGENELYGLAGNDLLIGGGGADLLDGGMGVDTASYIGAAEGITVNLRTGTASDGDRLISIENLVGSGFNDILTGDDGNNRIEGGDGDDVISGGMGNDILIGGGGSDTVLYDDAISGIVVSLALTKAQNTGGAGTDTLSGFENIVGSAFDDVLTGNTLANLLDGGAGNDVLIGGAGADVLMGGEGVDTASYAAGKVGVIVNLRTGTGQGGDAEGDTLIGVENLIGSAGADHLLGDAGQNILDGGAGNDVLFGDAGDDLLVGGAGADVLDGGEGNDTVSYLTSKRGVIVDLELGTGRLGDAAGDTYLSIENVIGSNAADVITGDAADNALYGLAGNDVLHGGAGNDVLEGGAGFDTLTGGADADVFYFSDPNSGADIITDFSAAEGDLIRISKAGFGISTTDFWNFLDVGAGVAGSASGQGQFLFDTDSSQLYWDIDGAGSQSPALIATLLNVQELTLAHFDFV